MKRHFALTTILLLAVMSAGMSGCLSHVAGLGGTYWRLTAYGAQSAATSVLAGTVTTLNFNSDGSRADGSSGCNDYFADCLFKGDSITITNLGATKKACSDLPGIMNQESAYFQMLGKAERFELNGDKLTINCAGNQELVFERINNLTTAADLSGTSWHLVSYGSGFWHTPLIPFTTITLAFDAGGSVAGGSAGINLYGADYVLSGDKITLSRVTSTDMSGFFPVIQQEKRYLKLLETSERLTLSGSSLTIYCSGDKQLHFQRD